MTEPGTKQSDEPAVERYTAVGWKERARNFRTKEGRSVSPHAIAGALHDVKADSTFSEDQVQKRLDKFFAKEHEVSS